MWTAVSAKQPVCLLTKSKNQAHLAAPKPCWSIGLLGFFYASVSSISSVAAITFDSDDDLALD